MTIKIGVSACFFHPDWERPLFKGKRLLYLEESYVHWIMSQGVLPILLPTDTSSLSARELMEEVDGLMLQGGSDVAPESYGESARRDDWQGDEVRDRYEIELIRRAMDVGKPVLGICRGMQILNVALGGDLHQDIGTDVPDTLVHRDPNLYDQLKHDISIRPSSRLSGIYQDIESARVNSIHHQAVKTLGEGLEAEAWSKEDGVVEAMRLRSTDTYVAAVQWHPEFHHSGDDEQLLDPEPLLQDFLEAVKDSGKMAKEIKNKNGRFSNNVAE